MNYDSIILIIIMIFPISNFIYEINKYKKYIYLILNCSLSSDRRQFNFYIII